MKKLIFLIIFLFSIVGFTQTADSLFVKANELYKTEKYTEAIELYKKIENLEVHSEELYFNLGNSYYKLNQVAPSIYYYEKSLKLNPRNSDALTNLAFSKRMTIDAIEAMPNTLFQKFSKNIIYKFTHNTWAIITVILAFLAVFLFFLYYFSYGSRKKIFFFNTSILSFIIFLVTFFFTFKTYTNEVNTKHAIVFQQTTEIKNAPTLNSDTIFELHEGTKVLVLDVIDDWKKIKLLDGKVGWIIAEHIKEI